MIEAIDVDDHVALPHCQMANAIVTGRMYPLTFFMRRDYIRP